MTDFKVEHHAMLFAWIAKAAIESFGADGEGAVLAGVRHYGEQRGRRMALRIQADGQKNDLLGYLLYGELKFEDTANVFEIIQKSPYFEFHAQKCAWNNIWRENNVLEYGRYYCQEIDVSILRGFNPGFRFEVDGTMTNGAPHCRFLFYGGKLGLLDSLRYLWRKRRLGDSAKRSWEFHVAELYNTFLETLSQEFGKSGRQAVQSAMDVFKNEYGAELANRVCSATNDG